jgi:DNA-binding IscR family transcriptional regulator
MLSALADARVRTADELARCAHVSASTATEHLGKLERAGLVAPAVHGPDACYRLANARVVKAVDDLWFAAERRSRHGDIGPKP